jgi:hypothetical protein
LHRKISEYAKENDILRIRRPNSIPLPLSSRPGEIEIDFAQQVSETIINKLLKKGIINLSEKQSFGDTYEYSDK